MMACVPADGWMFSQLTSYSLAVDIDESIQKDRHSLSKGMKAVSLQMPVIVALHL